MRPILELTRQMRRVLFFCFFLNTAWMFAATALQHIFHSRWKEEAFQVERCLKQTLLSVYPLFQLHQQLPFSPAAFLLRMHLVCLCIPACLYLSVWKWRALLCKQFLSAFTSSLLLELTLTSTADFVFFCIELCLFTDLFPALLKLILR